jgi:hypothetical protein
MKEFMRRIRADYMLSSILCILMGVAVIVWPEYISGIIGTLCAIVLIAIGAVYLGSYFLHVVTNGFSAALGAVVLLLGVWVLIQPEIVLTVIPVVIGVMLAAHGVRGLRESLAARKFGADTWGIGAVLAAISIVLGVICIVDAFGVVKLAFWVIGIALIYNGVSNIYIAITSSNSERHYRKNNETIDVEFHEDR